MIVIIITIVMNQLKACNCKGRPSSVGWESNPQQLDFSKCFPSRKCTSQLQTCSIIHTIVNPRLRARRAPGPPKTTRAPGLTPRSRAKHALGHSEARRNPNNAHILPQARAPQKLPNPLRGPRPLRCYPEVARQARPRDFQKPQDLPGVTPRL